MQKDITQTTTTALDGSLTDFSVATKNTDAAFGEKENKWINDKFTTYYGYYSSIGEYKSAINSFATWVIGQGYDCDLTRDKVILENINGWGEDTFLSILWNMLVVKKFAGDAYAEIIRNDKGTLINLKPLDPSRMAHILDKQGIIERYEYTLYDGNIKKMKPTDVLHFCNDRVADEPHGTSTTEAVEWAILALEEARRDWKRISHRSTIRVIYVEEDDKTRLGNLKRDYKEGIENGEVLILPGNNKDYQFQDLTLPPIDAFMRWIQYLGDQFYKQLGVPKVVLGGTAENTEASAKVGVIVYEPVWTREIQELEADIWNQLAIKIKIRKQPSLMDNMQKDEAKNTGQTKLEYQGSQ